MRKNKVGHGLPSLVALILMSVTLAYPAEATQGKPAPIKDSPQPEICIQVLAQKTKAFSLFLNVLSGVKESRSSAHKILTKTLAWPNLTEPEKEFLLEADKEVMTRFLTDKGQRLYEAALARLSSQTPQAIQNLMEALKIEDQNMAVDLALVRAYLIQEKCDLAHGILKPLNEVMAMKEVIQELQLEIAWCKGDKSQVESMLKRKVGDQKLTPAVQKTAQGWIKIQDGEDPQAAVSLFEEALRLEPKNPATLYWLWKSAGETMTGHSAAREFYKYCRIRQGELGRRSVSMSGYCYRQNEVENYLKTRGTEVESEGL